MKQPATTLIIISAVIIMMTLFTVLANILGIIACRFRGASINFINVPGVLYNLVSTIVQQMIDIVSVRIQGEYNNY